MKTFCKMAYIALILIGLGVSLAQHGTPKTGKYNFFIELFSSVIWFLLAYGAGMFN